MFHFGRFGTENMYSLIKETIKHIISYESKGSLSPWGSIILITMETRAVVSLHTSKDGGPPFLLSYNVYLRHPIFVTR